MDWTVSDFIVFGGLLAGVGIAYTLATRLSGNRAYRTGIAVALAGAFFLIWANGAVGIIGEPDNPANLMYAAVLAVGLIGAFVARFRAAGMTRALCATAAAHGVVLLIVLIAGLGVPGKPAPIVIVIANGIFIGLWLTSAWLFRKAVKSVSASTIAVSA